MAKDKLAADERLDWIKKKVEQSFKGVQGKKLDHFISKADNVTLFSKFLNRPEELQLFIGYNASTLQASLVPFEVSKGKGLIIFKKPNVTSIGIDNMNECLMVEEFSESLTQTNILMNHVFLPLVKNDKNVKGWPKVVSQDIRQQFDKFSAQLGMFVGHTRGETVLPVPLVEASSGASSSSSAKATKKEASLSAAASGATPAVDVDRSTVHALESAIIDWTREIRKSITSEPEKALNIAESKKKYHGPRFELNFWKVKSHNLQNLIRQLSDEKVSQVVSILEKTNSTYIESYKRIYEELVTASAIATSIHKHLQPLGPIVDALSDGSLSHEEYVESYRPVMHVISLVWETCESYDSLKLISLLRQVCNDIISAIHGHVDPSSLWEVEPDEAEQKLKEAIQKCDGFMTTFSQYRKRVNELFADRPERQWVFEKQTVFRRFTAFMERLHDLLDVVLHVKDYLKLERVEIGGIKGEMLTVLVRQVFEEFRESQEAIQRHDYDILDLTLPHFENDFYKFRSSVLDYDKRLCYVIDKGFKSCPTPATAFKLLESFESQARRDMIHAELFEKYILLMDLYTQDLTAVYHIFNNNKENPPVLSNLPKVSGSIAWVNALIDRISWPYNKLKQLPDEISAHPNMKRITKKYSFLVKQMRQFESHEYKTWVANVERVSREKLNDNVLQRLSDGRLSLNFDPQLTSSIQEVKYLNLFSMEVPDSATAVFDKKDNFRSFTGRLEVIVHQYNTVIHTLLDVERPLIQDRLEKIDQLMNRPLQELNWNAEDIPEFLETATTEVNDLYSRLNFLKGNVKTIEKMIDNWMNLYEVVTSNKEVEEEETSAATRIVRITNFWRNSNNLFNVPTQSLTNKIFLQWREKTSTAIYSPSDVIEQGARIQKIVATSLSKIEAQESDPNWIRYVQFLDETVQEGLKRSLANALKYLLDLMSPVKSMSEFGKPSSKGFTVLMESKLEFINNMAQFKPSIDPDDEGTIQSVTEYWLDRIFTISSKISKLSDKSETFGQISESKELLRSKEDIMDYLQMTIEKMQDLSNAFTQYSHLWEEDPKDLIQSLYEQAREEETMQTEEGQESGDLESVTRLPLARFDEEIQHYEQLHEEIMQLPDHACFGWISVDTSQIRYAISTAAKKWRYALLDWMNMDVKNSLAAFYEFVETRTVGLSQNVPKDDYPKLVEVMAYLMEIQERPEFTDEDHFEPYKETVTLLRKYDIKIPSEVTQQLDDAKQTWKALMKLFYEVKDKLSVLQNAEIKKISKDESDFVDLSEHYRKAFLAQDVFNYSIGVDHAYIFMDKCHLELMHYEKQLDELRRKQRLFGLIPNMGTPILSSRTDLKILKKIWDVASMVLWQIEDWKSIPFLKIDTDLIEDQVKKFSRTLKSIDKRCKNWDVFVQLDSYITNFQKTLPLVHDLRNDGMRDRHWQMLMAKTGVKFELSANFKLDNLLELNLHKFEEDVQEIVDRADKEIKLEAQLKQFEDTWSKLAFEFDTYKNLRIVRIPEEVVESLEDNQIQLQNIASMRFNDFFIDQVEDWVKKLGTLDTNMYLLLDVQRKWQYLETIFIGSEDIREQLPEESRRFDSIDTELRKILKLAEENPNLVTFTQLPGLDDLVLLQEKLAMCENKLTAYLEEKKKIFPRFYFTSIVDLLDILSKGGQAPHLIMRHMSKLFQAIKTLIFEKDSDGNPTNVAIGLIGNIKEEILMFKTPITLEGKVEEWLNRLKDHIKETLRLYLAEAIVSYEEHPREEWLIPVNAQLVLVTSQLFWTGEVLQAFEALEENNENAMKDYYGKQIDQLNTLIKAVQGDLDKKLRQKIMNLITIDVHARDIVERLIVESVTNSQAFLWQSQLRQRWDENEKDCFINIADAQFRYGYEFLGNAPRLVITPLTDRIYITLTQSLHLIMGGAPAGPAGTGKTETTKDLGAQLGISVYVFNCSDQMDNKSLGDIFKGLASSGSFGCFDEFNRISVEVLSVVSTQFKSILDALKEKKTRFLFEKDEISLDSNVGVFITMNPGYLGRTVLPESLKALFRPVTVVVPDFDLICENMLMAEGFIDAKILSQKFITLYRLNADLLSKQSHYDWGLRAIKSVLVVAGGLKRAEPHIPESHILMRALRDFNLPKIVPTDLDVFMGLIQDLFPGIDLERKQDLDFEQVISQTLVKNKLQPEDALVLKIVQLKEIMEVRHSIFIIGPAGCGKSTIWKNLAASMGVTGERVTIKDLNPKAITSHELYGRFNEVTGDWRDGLMSTTMRDLANIEDTKPKWIILDGDLDTEWIESMNSVMDDNRILTLANNDRIPLLQHMKLVFEIAHLKYATPATVSRAGILYVDRVDIGWQPYVASWIDRRPTTERAHMTILFDRYVSETLAYIQRNFKFVLEQASINMVETLCRLLEGLLTEENVPPGSEREIYEMYFIFCAVWAFGGPLGVKDGIDYRKQFDKWWRMTWRNQVKFPEGASVFDYYLDNASKRFERWSTRVERFQFEEDMSIANMMVPTEETTSVRYFLDVLIPLGYPALLVGNAGCGKTMLIEQQLTQLNKEAYEYRTINFNYYTDAEGFQMVMESNLEKKGGRRYGPPGSKRMVFFIDDLNMPLVDAYGTQSPIALLRQHLDYAHWYERSKWTLRDITKVQYLCSMNPTAGSFTVNDRLQRHFATFAINFPSDQALTTIYQQILDAHLHGFVKEVSSMSETVVKASLDLHTKISKEFTKTAQNFHYEFNLRHLSNVFAGLLQSQSATFKKSTKFAQLWSHEVTRVYHDLLSSTKDVETFHKVVGGVINQYFPSHAEAILEDKVGVFTHFAQGIGERNYDHFTTMNDLKKILEDALDDHNRQRTTMDLVLFEDAMRHVCRINRIIETGNALLVGVGGSGKQSLSRLAAFISDFDVYQITITRGYNAENLKEDLRAMYRKTGQKGESLIFLFTDTQIVDEKFLVYINDLLSSGNIPDLFQQEEIDEIANSLRTEVKAAGIVDVSTANCWKYFIQKVKQYLHVVLCFSPVGEDFRVRSRKFPALVNCTQIDWFFGWPEEALLSVADRFLREEEALGEHLDAVVQFMAFSQRTVEELSQEFRQKMKRYNYTTPKSFLEFIKLYKSLMSASLHENEEQILRLQGGIDKLESTTKQVTELEKVLVEQQKVVEEKKIEAEEMLEIVGKDKAIVEEENEKAKVEEEKTEAIASQVTEKEARCREELSKAEPMVQAAAEALDTLDKKELTEMRSFGSPPSAVVNVMCAVIILLSTKKVPKQKELNWAAAQKLMSKGAEKFLQELKEYDKEHIPDATVKAVRPYLDDPEFNPDVVRTKSNAAAGLCFWVQNIVAFHEINQKVIPLREDQAIAEKELAKAQAQLKKVKSKVKKLNDRLASLEAEFAAKEQEKADIIAKAKKTEESLALAQRLVRALASENVRWKQSIKTLKDDRHVIVGDVLLGAGFVSYAGSFDISFRRILRDRLIAFIKDRKIPSSNDLNVVKVLTDDATIAKWANEGLPNDVTSIENGCILTNCERWPLMIDPQLQGIAWIRGRFKENLHIVRLGTARLVETVERAIQNGHTVLVENIGEEIDAVLSPIIKREITKRGRSKFITLDNEVEYDDNFRLIFHTKLSNPHYIPEVQAETTLINFSVTMKGLEDQLLATVVSKERSDLEQKRLQLVEQMNEFKIKIKELEDALLENLQNAGDDILSDVELIENLEKTKETSEEIKIKVELGKKTEIEVNEARERYRNVAARGSLLYFLLDELKLIHSFYKYSLSSFETVFVRAMTTAKREDELNLRIEALIDSITFQVYRYTSRGLFEDHKLIFATNLCLRIHSKDLDSQELRFLMTGERDLQPPDNPFTEWLSEECWQMVCTLQTIPAFAKLVDDMQGSSKRWAAWSMFEAPERQKLPQDWKNKTHLQRLCVIRAIRPDRLTHAMREFVGAKMGRRYIDSIPFQLDQIYAESNPSTPMFFILSPGANPVKQIEALGKKLGFSDENSKFANIALGRGQEKRAEEELDRAYKHGGWVVLQNIHLMQKWLPILERKLEKLSVGSHKDFRVYLSAEPHPVPLTEVIPQSILQNSIKLTNEPPEDLKSNIIRAFSNFNQETLESCLKQNEFKTILFTLCFFHAIVLGRRKFGFQGWSTPYSFNMGDLTISADVLYNYLEANDDIPWEDIKYIFGEIMYGGHITDQFDRRTCSSYLDIYMNDRLFDGAELGPGFPTPQPSNFDEYLEYIEASLPDESPLMFGLHSNAEITYLSQQSSKLLDTLTTLSGGTETEGEGQTKEEIVNERIDFILPQIPENFNMEEIYSRVDKRTPFVNVCLQECERMNLLMDTIRTSLIELQQGLSGALTISEQMDELLNDLFRDKVPTQWALFPSLRGLGEWFQDVLKRITQLEEWSAELQLPKVVWLSGLFNPQSFLTAIMQTAGRKTNSPLNDMVLQTEVTKKMDPTEFTGYPRDGCYIHGLYLEGAGWDLKQGVLCESKLKELRARMPVIHVKAVPRDKAEMKSVYLCPVYVTSMRGAVNYVFTAQLKTKAVPNGGTGGAANPLDSGKLWTMRGVCLLLTPS